MDARDLAVFVQVVESGDFSAAARVLSLTPSAVSKAMNRLEDRLGRRLVHRSSRAMHLTEEGHDFLLPARRVVAALEEAEAVGSRVPSGTLRVRSLPTFARYQLAPLMPKFLRLHPGLRLDFQLGNERSAWLEDGADVAIASGDLPASSLVARRIATSRWVICAAPAYLAEHGEPKTLADLAEHQCLNFSMPTRWNRWSFEDGGKGGRITTNQGDMLRALARAGAGIVRLAEFHISDDLRAGLLIPLISDVSDCSEEPIYVLHRERKNLSPRIKAFIDFLTDSFAHPPWKSRSSAGS